MKLLKYIGCIVCLTITAGLSAQDISLFQQFNGRYDYIAFGNTLNTSENSAGGQVCEILTSSSADFELQPNQTLVAAYLYWAGSGNGDFDILFNNTPISAERTFSNTLGTLTFFAAYADVTSLVAATGNGNYTVSELDLTNDIPVYCNTTTNFGGWAVTVIYEDPNVSLNQLNVFDGLESVSESNPELNIELDNLNVLDNIGAKIGFTSWEGDASLAVNETLQVNGNIISNPPLNPPANAFNSTNSFTGSSELYNMDLDFYNIENNIQPGDQSAVITLTSGDDFVMINNVITVLNTELPDATIEIEVTDGSTECDDREITVDYTVFNVNSTDVLPTNTPIAFYANSSLIGQSATTVELPIGGQESGSITLTVPASIPADFNLIAVVDDTGTGTGIVNELNEDNNEAMVLVHLQLFPEIIGLQDLEQCDVVGIEVFDLTEATAQIDPVNDISYHTTQEDAENNQNAIVDPEIFQNTSNPQTIYIRVANPDCSLVASFEIEVIDCPLPDVTITIDNTLNACRQRDLTIDYTVYNTMATGPLPANTPIAFYANNVLVGQAATVNVIPVGGSESGTISVPLPENIPDVFILKAVVDDTGNGTGTIFELNEGNNNFDIQVEFMSIPPIVSLPDLLACDIGFDTALFNLREQDPLIAPDGNGEINYFTNQDDAIANTNPIGDPEQYENGADPQLIFVRLETEVCFATASFLIKTENCAPEIPQGMSPNGDGLNDPFKIKGLVNVFEQFVLKIYSRQGNLIYEGGNEEGLWDGIPNTGLLYKDNLVPVGTYYYVLILNDPEFPEPFLGFVYVNY
jgi:gliding motility-associated-like protein